MVFKVIKMFYCVFSNTLLFKETIWWKERGQGSSPLASTAVQVLNSILLLKQENCSFGQKSRKSNIINVYLINLPCFCVVLVKVVHKNPIDLERDNMPTGRVKIFTSKYCLSSVERYRRRSPATKDIDTVSNSCLRYELNNWVANVLHS